MELKGKENSTLKLNNELLNSEFSHIYVEESILEHPRVKSILSHFLKSKVVQIKHYKDVFNRRHESAAVQRLAPALILASKPGRLIYDGAPVCQSFGNEHFYYTSCVMNCVYNCEYCYLQGMYPSGNIVIFINIEDIFAELTGILKEHDAYVCVSYDTDLMAIENLTGFVKQWCDFAAENPGLKIEIRTKCGRRDLWDKLAPSERVIFAFTLSPDEVQRAFEKKTGSLSARISSAAYAMELGFPVRLCFDPMIYVAGWKEKYGEMLAEVWFQIDGSRLVDVSVGSFRISADYLKTIRKNNPDSAVCWFPFVSSEGYYHYPDKLMNEMEEWLVSEVRKQVPEEKIFRWKE